MTALMLECLPRCQSEDATVLYLDLLKRTLTNWVYADAETPPVRPQGRCKRAVVAALHWFGFTLVRRPRAFNPRRRAEGRDWPAHAHTMIGLKRLDHLQACLEQVLRDDVPGDLIETGVWRGGAAIFMRAVLKAYAVNDRCVWLADSFEGLPPPNAQRYPQDAGSRLHDFGELAVSQEQVQANFDRYGLLDDQVRFLKGWFRDTLPAAPIDRLALLRLDGDMYESTMDALTHLYPKLSLGGFVIVDDYGPVPGCYRAIQDFRRMHHITDEIRSIDWSAVYWRRSR